MIVYGMYPYSWTFCLFLSSFLMLPYLFFYHLLSVQRFFFSRCLRIGLQQFFQFFFFQKCYFPFIPKEEFCWIYLFSDSSFLSSSREKCATSFSSPRVSLRNPVTFELVSPTGNVLFFLGCLGCFPCLQFSVV